MIVKNKKKKQKTVTAIKLLNTSTFYNIIVIYVFKKIAYPMWNVLNLVFNLEQNLGRGTLAKPEILHRKERNV